MAIPQKLALPLRLSVALAALVFGACSSGGAGHDSSADGSAQHIDGEKAGSAGTAGKAASSDGGAGSQAEPDETGNGNTGSVGETETGHDGPQVDEPTGGKSGGSDQPSASAGAAGDPDTEPATLEPSEAFLRGQELVAKSECVTCHQQNFAGFTVFPNITPDVETGIGSWTDAQIVSAVRDGVDADGATLCATMQRYSFTDEQASDVVAFLRGLPAVSNRLTGVCPGHAQ